MKYILTLIGVSLQLMAVAQDTVSIRTAPSSMQYKLYRGGNNTPLAQGDLLKISMEQRIEDSVLMTSSESGHQMVTYDTNYAKQTYFFTEIMPVMYPGDSAVCILATDTIIAKFFAGQPPEAIPPFIKPGKRIFLMAKIVKKYDDSASFTADAKVESALAQAWQQKQNEMKMAAQKELDAKGFAKSSAELEAFLGDRKNKMIKTASGAYVEIIQPGTGAPCATGKTVAVRYRGTLLSGEEFDGNMAKPTDGPKKPAFDMVPGTASTIPGFDQGIQQLRKGSRAKIYIPAEAGYGGQAAGPVIKPYSNLIFEIFIEDVKDAAGATAKPAKPGKPAVKKPVAKKPVAKKPVKK